MNWPNNEIRMFAARVIKYFTLEHQEITVPEGTPLFFDPTTSIATYHGDHFEVELSEVTPHFESSHPYN
jgi:hypothetical protein